MKTVFSILIIFLFVVGCSAYVYAADRLRSRLDRRAFLRAIDQVESGGRDGARGADGERGRYQITRRVWASYTNTPFIHAHRRDLAHAVAEQHLDWIVNQLDLAGWPSDAEACAMAWNAGLTATVNNHLSPASRDYAERVRNLYEELTKKGGAS